MNGKAFAQLKVKWNFLGAFAIVCASMRIDTANGRICFDFVFCSSAYIRDGASLNASIGASTVEWMRCQQRTCSVRKWWKCRKSAATLISPRFPLARRLSNVYVSYAYALPWARWGTTSPSTRRAVVCADVSVDDSIFFFSLFIRILRFILPAKFMYTSQE